MTETLKSITIEYISQGEILRERSDRANSAYRNLKELDLLNQTLGIQLIEIENAYKEHCNKVINYVFNLLPERVVELFTQFNYNTGHYFPSLILTKNNEISVKLGKGWVTMRLLLNIETNELRYDSFGFTCNETDLKPYEAEIINLMKNLILNNN